MLVSGDALTRDRVTRTIHQRRVEAIDNCSQERDDQEKVQATDAYSETSVKIHPDDDKGLTAVPPPRPPMDEVYNRPFWYGH